MYRHKKTRISPLPIRVFYYLCPVQPPAQIKKCTFRFNFWYISFCGL
nr:MAG TPA: hypothetical protein [Caudoviricetes sp.]